MNESDIVARISNSLCLTKMSNSFLIFTVLQNGYMRLLCFHMEAENCQIRVFFEERKKPLFLTLEFCQITKEAGDSVQSFLSEIIITRCRIVLI